MSIPTRLVSADGLVKELGWPNITTFIITMLPEPTVLTYAEFCDLTPRDLLVRRRMYEYHDFVDGRHEYHEKWDASDTKEPVAHVSQALFQYVEQLKSEARYYRDRAEQNEAFRRMFQIGLNMRPDGEHR